MRRVLLAVLLGTFLCVLNHAGVIAGILHPPPGYEPAYYILNLDVPQYLTWAELSKTHWLLPNYHAPWITEPALFQPLFQIVGRLGLPTIVSYYLLELIACWLAAYALILAAVTFCTTRRQMLYAALVVVCAIPIRLFGWAVAKALGLPLLIQAVLGYGVLEYAYDTADGLLRGGLSDSFTLSFGTAITLFAFVQLARFVVNGRRKHFRWLLVCVFLGGFFHPFEVFLITAAAVWPLLKIKRTWECVLLFTAAGLGMLPYVIQNVRSSWVRDASELAQQNIGSPAWVLFVFGLPAILICWLMMIRFRVERPEDEILQSWFICGPLVAMIPLVPGAMHLFDGYAYCVGFLLVRKATQDKLFTRLFAQRPRIMQSAVAAWGLVSALVLGTVYVQVWKDGKTADPELFLSAVRPKDEGAMLAWMKRNLPQQRLVLAPERMAPWVAALPMPALASHDLFSITYEPQRKLAERFYKGEDVRDELIGGYGVSYVVAPKSAPLRLSDAKVLHEEASLRLYEIPGEQMKPYPGAEHLAGAKPKTVARRWLLRLFAMIIPR